MDAIAPNPFGAVLWNPSKGDILLFILIENHVFVFVPSTLAKWISFRNHRNRNVLGGKHNLLVHYVDVSALDPSGVVLCNPFIWDILLLFILIENRVVCFCAFHTSKMNFILQPQEQKSCGRQTQCSSTLCGCQCTWPIWCCPLQPFQMQMRYFVVHFWSKIMLLFLCLPHQQNEFHSSTKQTGKL